MGTDTLAYSVITLPVRSFYSNLIFRRTICNFRATAESDTVCSGGFVSIFWHNVLPGSSGCYRGSEISYEISKRLTGDFPFCTKGHVGSSAQCASCSEYRGSVLGGRRPHSPPSTCRGLGWVELYLCCSLAWTGHNFAFFYLFTYIPGNLTFVCPCIVSIIVIDDQQDATILVYLFIYP